MSINAGMVTKMTVIEKYRTCIQEGVGGPRERGGLPRSEAENLINKGTQKTHKLKVRAM